MYSDFSSVAIENAAFIMKKLKIILNIYFIF